MKKIPLQDVLQAVALSPNVVSRKPIWEKYDKNVQGNTFVERGEAAVPVIVPFNDYPELPKEKQAVGVAVGTGGNPNVAKIDAKQAAAMGICEAALKTACVGGDWLGVTDCLNFGNPEKKDQMGLFVAGVEGVKEACKALEIPIVSGNVSLYNESNGKSIPPSALVSVFARVNEVEHIKPMYWTEPELFLYRIGGASTALGGSEFNRIFKVGSTELPMLDYGVVAEMAQQVRDLLTAGSLAAVMPLRAGGVWGTLVNAALKGGNGFVLNLETKTAITDLFAENLEVIVASSEPLEGLELLGKTTAGLSAVLEIGDEHHDFDLSMVADEWSHQLRAVV